jgi:hypothetical protein
MSGIFLLTVGGLLIGAVVSAVYSVVSDVQRRRREQRINEAVGDVRERTSTLRGSVRQAEERFRERQNRADSEISALTRELDEIIRVQNERFNKYVGDIESSLARLRENILEDMEAQKKELQDELSGQCAFLNRELENTRQKLSERFNKIEETQKNYEKQAEYWIEETLGLIKDIESIPHFHLCAENVSAINKIQTAVEGAVQDIKDRAFETAISTARTAFGDAFELKERVVFAETEWTRWFSVFNDNRAKLVSDFEDGAVLQFEFETNAGKELIDAELDYWTRGNFSIARKYLQDLTDKTRDENSMTIQDFRIALDDMAKLHEELSVIERNAKENIVKSQERYTMAEKMAEFFAMEYNMTECEGAWAESEQREAYHAKYVNNKTGDEVIAVIQAAPDNAGIAQNNLELHFITRDNSEDYHHKLAKDVTESLKKSDIRTAQAQCKKGYENRSSDQKYRVDPAVAKEKKKGS